ncbi:hypothetical protein SAMN05216176_11185 [Nitratireductor indicus]|nr:hypothetical protein SAMN05216176_11185 [Nitratireductor indicus]
MPKKAIPKGGHISSLAFPALKCTLLDQVMTRFLRVGILALAPLVFSFASTATSFANNIAQENKSAATPQYVIISFDGAQHIAQWQRSRALGREINAHFSYFLSCVYLLTPETRFTYKAPGFGKPRSNVGYAQSRDEVAGRLDQIWQAHLEGHDISSHGCGHFDGKGWSLSDWNSEFEQFTDIVGGAWKRNGIEGEPAGWQDFVHDEIRGFRAPYLSTNNALYKALAGQGFLYDASGVSKGPVLPKARGGVERFSLPLIPEGPNERNVIAMDYNLYVRHSGGKERPEKASVYEERAYEAFLASFDKQYRGQRIPVQLGFHFTLMNGGAYWNALERFAREVCSKNDVRCVSYRDYLAAQAGDERARPKAEGGGT